MRIPAFSPVSRRAVLGGLAAAGALTQLRTAPGFAATRSTAIDHAIARMIARGQARDAALRKAFPFGRSDGVSPYVVSARHGAYLDLKADPATRAVRIDLETVAVQAEAVRHGSLPGFAIDQAIVAMTAALPTSGTLREAMLRQIAALRAIRRDASDTAGVWRFPHGADYYRLRLRCTTGSDQSPAEVDREVGAEIAALSKRADRLLRLVGLHEGSVGTRLRALKAKSAQYTNNDPGRQAALAGMNQALERLRPHLPRWFNPPFEAGSTIRAMTSDDQKAARRGYRDPPTAGAPGAYFPDLGAVHERPPWTLATVAFHEAVPGHLLQIGRQAAIALPPSPLQLRFAPGYSEGWAIYAESLVDRSGLLSPVEQLGFLQSWLFRLARVRADIGIHVHRWTQAQAIRFLEETVGFELFYPFAVEVDRYCIEPASFAGDAIVALTLRNAAPQVPAEMRKFHDRILDHGPLSLEALAENVSMLRRL